MKNPSATVPWMPNITVAGTGRQRAPAENATIVVSSRQRASDPAAAMREVAAAHSARSADARRFVEDGAATHWQADHVWISRREEWVGDSQEPRHVFEAAANVQVTFVDIAAMAVWVGRIGTLAIHEVNGVQWSLSDATRAVLERGARALAVEDAIGKAGDFAAAASLGKPKLVELREAGLSSPADEQPRPLFALPVGRAEASDPVLELQAGEIEVTASISVLFES